MSIDTDDNDPNDRYMIIRYFRDPSEPKRCIKLDLTLEEAQEHCNDEDSHDVEAGWFDGYTLQR